MTAPEKNSPLEKKAMSIDSLVVGQDDSLLNSLDFSLPATSSYLLERRNVVYMSENGGKYSPNTRTSDSLAFDWLVH